MKIATFNVNSIKMRLDIVKDWLQSAQPSVLGIQELKCKDEEYPHGELANWHSEVHGQSAYNGVALISDRRLENVVVSLSDDVQDKQARLIAGNYGGVSVINTYCPQGSEVGSDKFTYKLNWFDRFMTFLSERYDPNKPLAWVGDYNVAPEDQDVYAPDFFDNDVGAHPDERSRIEALREWGFTDIFRHFHPDRRKAFTFFDYRTRDAVKYKKGWRIDHIWVTAPLLERARACDIDMEPRLLEKPSDHTPLWADFEDA